MKKNPFIKDLKEKYENEVFNWCRMEQDTGNRYVSIDNLNPNTTFMKKLILYKREEFLDNPYIKNIKISRIVGDNFILSRGRILPRNCVEKFNEASFDSKTMTFNHPFYYCEDNLQFPVILEKNDKYCWMSVEPFEINSFDKIVQEAHGNVLLLGLGLGYLPYMLSIKDNVNSITVIEIDDEIIRMFKENILPQFEYKEKIKIVKDNGINYLKSSDLNLYDYVNLDIWKATSDMLPYYLQALNVETKHPNVKFSYWLEQELKCELQRAIIRAAIKQPIGSDFDEMASHILKKSYMYERTKFVSIMELNNFREIMHLFYLEHQSTYDNAADNLASQYVKKYKITSIN